MNIKLKQDYELLLKAYNELNDNYNIVKSDNFDKGFETLLKEFNEN